MQDYFTGIEQLTGFLINRQGHDLQTSNGVVFKQRKTRKPSISSWMRLQSKWMPSHS
jgi:hypothetical protein